MSLRSLPSPVDDDVDPRVARSRARIRWAAVNLLGDVGYDSLSMEAIAEEAEVGKATIYRHWESKAELVIDAIACLKQTAVHEPTDDAFADILAILGALGVALNESTWAALLPTMLDASRRDTEMQRLMIAFVTDRRASLRGAIERANHMLPGDTDQAALLDMLVGPLFYRRFVGQQQIDQEWVVTVAQTVWSGVGGVRQAR